MQYTVKGVKHYMHDTYKQIYKLLNAYFLMLSL